MSAAGPRGVCPCECFFLPRAYDEKFVKKMSVERKGIVSAVAEVCHQAVLGVVRRTVQQGRIEIDSERCKGCELCVYECPAHTLSLSAEVNRRGYRHSEQVRPGDCIGCASCALVCPDGCIEVWRRSLVPHSPLQEDMSRAEA